MRPSKLFGSTLLIVTLLNIAPAKAAGADELSSFSGKFSGPLTVTSALVPDPLGGQAQFRGQISKSGTKGRLILDGSVINSVGNEVPIKMKLTLTKGGKVAVSEAAPGVSQNLGVRGRYSVRRGKILFKFRAPLVGDFDGNFVGRISVRGSGGSRSISFYYSTKVIGGSEKYTYRMSGSPAQ